MSRCVAFDAGFEVLKTALGRHGAKNNFLLEKYRNKLKKCEEGSQDYPDDVLRCEIYREIIKDLESPIDGYFLISELR